MIATVFAVLFGVARSAQTPQSSANENGVIPSEAALWPTKDLLLSRNAAGSPYSVITTVSRLVRTALASQWEVFFQRLCEADCVIIVGYPLPEADTQARSKILTSFQANPKSRWLVIDPSSDVCGRFHRLLGQSRLTVLQATLAGVNNDLTKHLQAAFDSVDFSDPPAAAAPAAAPDGDARADNAIE